MHVYFIQLTTSIFNNRNNFAIPDTISEEEKINNCTIKWMHVLTMLRVVAYALVLGLAAKVK